MKALELLPKETKDRIFPCFLLAPWVNSNRLKNTIKHFEKSYAKSQYFLDIDRDYKSINSDSESQIEFLNLQKPSNCFQNWVEFVRENKWIVPCVQFHGQSEKEITKQIKQFQELGRDYCVRIERSRFPSNLDEILEVLKVQQTADFYILLEAGWARNPLTLQAWFDGIIAKFLQNLDVPVIVSTTAMPKQFSSIEGFEIVPNKSRELFERIQTRWGNQARLIFGDWGSTRPREPSSFASRPLPRIDYPLVQEWCIARNKFEEWTYQEAAIEIMNQTKHWVGNLNIWGEDMIKVTVNSEELGVNSPSRNVAARVNIHLHLQAWQGGPDIRGVNFEEDWVD